MVTHIIFVLAINCKNQLLLLELQKRKNRQMLCEGLSFRMCCISKIIKARTFLQLWAYKKNNRGYHIPMIDLGESKKVTSVLKKIYFFFICLELPGVIIFRNNFCIFTILNT